MLAHTAIADEVVVLLDWLEGNVEHMAAWAIGFALLAVLLKWGWRPSRWRKK